MTKAEELSGPIEHVRINGDQRLIDRSNLGSFNKFQLKIVAQCLNPGIVVRYNKINHHINTVLFNHIIVFLNKIFVDRTINRSTMHKKTYI